MISPKKFMRTYLTQSENVSAKIALCIEENLANFMDYIVIDRYQKELGWKYLKDPVMYTIFEVFLFYDHTYYFRMMKNAIDSLIPNGIMKYLIENYYLKTSKLPQIEMEPKVLSLDDLLFGFKIWLGCCLISFFGLMVEFVVKFGSQIRNPFTSKPPQNNSTEGEIHQDDAFGFDSSENQRTLNEAQNVVTNISSEIESEMSDDLDDFSVDFDLDLHLDILDLLKVMRQ